MLVTAKGQHAGKENPIIYADSFLGGAGGRAGGFSIGLGLNYQIKHSLLSLRYLGNLKLNSKWVLLTPVTALPVINEKSNSEEYAALYGYRLIKTGHAFSFSLGVSHNSFSEYLDETNQQIKKTSSYLGVPYEANVNWFKKEKRKYRIYGVIPVGKPTSFGNSLGLKIFGNISENSILGIGLTGGLGYHKKY